mmetsp:Transcript_14095/g.20623  ORF Transcript_14095/g.20623 Transcript_14095/m.20623 type:complete len:190 (+) Transcript_14095:23-592(+)
MAEKSTGSLIIRPLSAKLMRDTETFGKMDPYCVVTIGGQRQKTKVKERAGRHPNWQDSLVFRRSSEEEVVIEVWDKDKASNDDLVGKGSLRLEEVFRKPVTYEEWIDLTYRRRKAGKILVNVSWVADPKKAVKQKELPQPTYHSTFSSQFPYTQSSFVPSSFVSYSQPSIRPDIPDNAGIQNPNYPYCV